MVDEGSLASTGIDAEAQRHRPVQGLPRSLLAREARSFAVVALMQREGWLSRDRRREVVSDQHVGRIWPEGVDTSLPRAELNLLARFLEQQQRAISFWNLVAARRDRRRSDAASSYIVSLEAQLLRSYEPAWDSQEFDEEALCAVCPPWPVIRARIEEETSRLVRRPRMSPCMLWAALREDLERWPALDEPRRRAAAHGVFALSSVCWTDWFVREAIRLCPELEPELGGTLAAPLAASPAAAPPSPSARVPLASIVERLRALCAELEQRPSQEALRELDACALDAQAWAPALPDRQLVAMRELRLAVEALLEGARDRAQDSALRWLGPEVLSQIEARWTIAARGRDAAAVRSLAHDAEQALQRFHNAAGRCMDAEAALRAARERVQRLDDELEAAATLSRRRDAERSRSHALGELLVAETALPGLEDALLASLSPWAEAFDVDVDYRGELTWAVAAEAADAAAAAEQPAGRAADSVPATELPVTVAMAGELAELLTG